MAAAHQRPAPFTVLSNSVDMDKFEVTGEPGQGWRKIERASKRSYGCGDLGHEVVQSLRLYMRLRNEPVLTTSLGFGMSDKAVRSIEAELELSAPSKRRLASFHFHEHEMIPGSIVQIVDQRLIVFVVLAFRCVYCRRDLVYCLVYDDIDASLAMIRHRPDDHETVCMLSPLVNRAAAIGGGYELLIRSELQSHLDNQCVLFACTLETTASSGSNGNPWQMKKAQRFPEQVRLPDLDVAEGKWTKVVEFKRGRMDGFKKAGLPEALPECPILAADGSLCVVLPDQVEMPEYGAPAVNLICCFDVRRKRLLCHGRVHNYHSSNTVVLPDYFFGGQHVSREHLPAAG